MLNYLLLLAAAVLSVNANAEIYKCKSPDGKIRFSDTACVAGARSEIIPDRAPVTEQERFSAQQRAVSLQNEAAALDAGKAAARTEQQARAQRQEVETAKKMAATREASSDADAIANCVRDVERRGASQNVKAEMIAACRTAGIVQRSTALSGDAVSDCVKRVERTGASEKDKARQLATCHGGDVQPEQPRVVAKPAEFKHPAVVKNCLNGKCSDQYGTGYRKDVMGNVVRQDGRRCRQHGNTLVCD